MPARHTHLVEQRVILAATGVALRAVLVARVFVHVVWIHGGHPILDGAATDSGLKQTWGVSMCL